MTVHPSIATLVAELIEAGELREGTPLANAFATVDRGIFVPAFALPDHSGDGVRYRLVDGRLSQQRAEWARHVYADETLIIEVKGQPVTEALPAGTGSGRWTSSSTMPSLMARHLRELDLEANPRVLEIGVGSGYNTAILCEVLGDEHRHLTPARGRCEPEPGHAEPPPHRGRIRRPRGLPPPCSLRPHHLHDRLHPRASGVGRRSLPAG